MAVMIQWTVEVTETYSRIISDDEARELYGTTDPDEIKDAIDAEELAGDEEDEYQESANVSERWVNNVTAVAGNPDGTGE